MWRHSLAALGLCTVIVTSAEARMEETALCYRLRYGKRDSKERYEHNVLIKPITTFPEFHPVVKNRVCDKFKQGDRIPGTKLASQELQKDPKGFDPKTFAQKFKASKIPRWQSMPYANKREKCLPGKMPNGEEYHIDDMDCIDRERGYANCDPKAGYMNSGALWYGYNFPKKWSANTGYEETKIGKFYFISDSDHDGWLVIVFDKADNQVGGEVKFTLEIETVEPTFIAARDDPPMCARATSYTMGNVPTKTCNATTSGATSCANWVHTGDDYSGADCLVWKYDKQNNIGRGSFSLKWKPCCSDGLVLGPIPDASFKANIKFQKITALNSFKVGNFDPQSSKLKFVPLTSADVTLGIQIEGDTCDSYCSGFSNDCDGCYKNKLCGYCNQNDKCMATKESAQCAWGWVPWVELSEQQEQGKKCYQPKPTTTTTTGTTTTTTTTTTTAAITTTITTAATKKTMTTTTAATATIKDTDNEIEVDGVLWSSQNLSIWSASFSIVIIFFSLL